MIEKSIFDYIKDILFTKKGIFISESEDSSQFQPYMIQRWCSMSSKDATLILNETTNRWGVFFNNKDFIYKILLGVLPRQKQKKINYIKKPPTSGVDDLKDISNTAELSKREIKAYINDLKSNVYDRLDPVS